MQPLLSSLGDQRADDGIRRGNHPSAGRGEVLRSPAIDHFGQRAAVHRQGFQRVHPHFRDDACENVAVLSAVQRQDSAVSPADKLNGRDQEIFKERDRKLEEARN